MCARTAVLGQNIQQEEKQQEDMKATQPNVDGLVCLAVEGQGNDIHFY